LARDPALAAALEDPDRAEARQEALERADSGRGLGGLGLEAAPVDRLAVDENLREERERRHEAGAVLVDGVALLAAGAVGGAVVSASSGRLPSAVMVSLSKRSAGMTRRMRPACSTAEMGGPAGLAGSGFGGSFAGAASSGAATTLWRAPGSRENSSMAPMRFS